MESRSGAKAAMAKVALPGGAIPGLLRDSVGVRVARPSDELLGDDALGVLGADKAVDLIAGHVIGGRAGARLEMVNHACGGGVHILAERAGDVLAAMDAGVQVLLVVR